MTARCRAASPRLAAVAVLLALASAVIWPARSFSADETCDLTSQQKIKAVKAFKALAPIFQEPRCLNCHGAVNPFSRTGGHGGGYIDIREEVRRFLERPDLHTALFVGSDPTGAIAASTLQRFREIADSRDEITDNDWIRPNAHQPMVEACAACHVSGWVIPMSKNHFAGRDWKAMCVQMKTADLTDTPVEFLHHMQSDELVLRGFEGKRGLTEATDAEPPSMSSAAVAQHANEWIAAMGGEYHDPPECGCEADGIILEIRHRMQADPQSSWSRSGMAQFDGAVAFEVLLERLEGTPLLWYRGEATVTRPLVVRHVTPSFTNCAGSGTQTEYWRVDAMVAPDESSMVVRFGFLTDDEESEWTCTVRGYKTTDVLYVDLDQQLDVLEMPVAGGAVGRAESRNVQFIESISMTVIDSPYGP